MFKMKLQHFLHFISFFPEHIDTVRHSRRANFYSTYVFEDVEKSSAGYGYGYGRRRRLNFDALTV